MAEMGARPTSQPRPPRWLLCPARSTPVGRDPGRAAPQAGTRAALALSREPPPSPIPTDLPRPDEGAQGPRKKGVGSGHRQGADGEAGLVGREATWRVGRRPAAAEAEQRHRRAAYGPLQTVRYRRSITDGPLPALSLWAGGGGVAAGSHGGHSLPPGGPDTCPPSPAAHGRFCQRHTPLVEARARGSRPRWREAAEGEASHTRGRGRGTECAWEPGLRSPRPPVFTGSHAGLPRARFAGICE